MSKWQTKLLKQLYTPLNNLSYSRDFLTETPQQVAYIHYGDIHTDKIPEVVSGKTTLAFLLDSISIPSEEKYLLKEGDIVLVDASEDYEGVGKNIEISAIQNKKIVSGLHTIALRPIDATNLTPGFGRYLLKHPLVSKRLKAIAQGTKVFSISFTLIQKLKVPFPPLEEQRKIVEVLETWDKAIQLTRKLIEQKELQKKYLMQQLLTGRTRLKGFTGKWKKVHLENMLYEVDKRTTCNNQYQIMSVTKNGIYSQQEYFDKQIASENNIGYKILRRSNIVFSPMNLWMGSIGFFQKDIGIVSPAYKIFSINPKIALFDFLRYFMTTPKMLYLYKINSEMGASIVRRNLDINGLLSSDVFIPSIKEQYAIAKVISTSDKQVDLLKQKLAKLEEQKKGLMQILLTGKVRLNW
ncbi:restriction endonuclease subunit S [Candidatus Avelusimicrobium facis]|uniref:restriction endonuclease subunit S n=1 Tax=Candidatus Avelusimicrobium facis TaxID=3416203 RepID=UPI003D0F9A1B